MPDLTTWTQEHAELRAALKVRVQKSITSAGAEARTVEDPAKAAEYVVNALVEWPAGQALVWRLAAHLDRAPDPSSAGDEEPHVD